MAGTQMSTPGVHRDGTHHATAHFVWLITCPHIGFVMLCCVLATPRSLMKLHDLVPHTHQPANCSEVILTTISKIEPLPILLIRSKSPKGFLGCNVDRTTLTQIYVHVLTLYIFRELRYSKAKPIQWCSASNISSLMSCDKTDNKQRVSLRWAAN